MSLPEANGVLQHERAFWQDVASRYAPTGSADNDWPALVAYALGDVRGTRVLDCGTGAGELARQLARRGAAVTSADLSEDMLRLARRTSSGGLAVPSQWIAADCGALPFKDDSFDRAAGNFILHHVQTAPALQEIRRVLRPGGRALFSETWLGNPVLAWARQHVVGRFGVARWGTRTEHPITPADIALMHRIFGSVTLHFPRFVLFAMIGNNVFRWEPRFRPITDALLSLDAWCGAHLPWLRRYGYYCLIELRNDEHARGADHQQGSF